MFPSHNVVHYVSRLVAVFCVCLTLRDEQISNPNAEDRQKIGQIDRDNV